jgi:hypothetical protein
VSIAERINELSQEFDKRCLERHVLGEEKYGAGTWMGIDTLEMAIEEVIDLANYTRFTYIKLRLLQANMAEFAADKSTARPIEGNETLGKDALIKGGLL